MELFEWYDMVGKLREKHMEKYEILKYLANKCYYDCSMNDYAPKTKQRPEIK